MDKTIDMAREAGLIVNSPYLMPHDYVLQGIKRFEALVRADEREACAKLVGDIEARCIAKDVDDPPLKHIADAIRARGNT